MGLEVTPIVANPIAPTTPNPPATAPAPSPAAPAEPAAATTTEPAKEPKLAKRFEALAKEEKRIRSERDAAKAEREEVQRIRSQIQEWEQLRAQIKKDPLSFLEKEGWTYNDLTKLKLAGGKDIPLDPQIRNIQQEMEKLKAELAEKETKTLEAQKAAEKARVDGTIKTFVGEIGQFIAQNQETYELTALREDGADLVYNVIEQHHAKTFDKTTGLGKILSTKEAADYVEKYLEEAELAKILGTKKAQSRLSAPASASAPAKSGAQTSSKTLTNSQATAAPTPATQKPQSYEDSLENAKKLLRWT